MFHVFNAATISHILFKLFFEVSNCTCHRPCSGITERTNCFSFYFRLNVPQKIYILQCAMSIQNAVQNFFHPACFLRGMENIGRNFHDGKNVKNSTSF